METSISGYWGMPVIYTDEITHLSICQYTFLSLERSFYNIFVIYEEIPPPVFGKMKCLLGI